MLWLYSRSHRYFKTKFKQDTEYQTDITVKPNREINVLGISMGSSKRDHSISINLLDYKINIKRQGTDGDFKKAIKLYIENDGKVDAFGVGGTEFYLFVGNKKYFFRDQKEILKTVKKSKIGDGNGVKHILEKRVVDSLEDYGIDFREKKIFHICGMARYSLVQALADKGGRVSFGDLISSMGIPVPIRKMTTLKIMAIIFLPIVTKMPFKWFYPLGEEQDSFNTGRSIKLLENADIIAGDFLFIKKSLPNKLHGKIIITNTTTADDVKELKKRGLNILVTSTPRYDGRSFGTNIIEAMVLSMINKPQSEITEKDVIEMIDQIPIKPNIELLNSV